MMKTKGMKLAAICLTGALLVGSVYSPVDAAKKVTIKGKKSVSMKVGQKKQFKANQKVKWTVKGKSVTIVKGKNAKAATVQAKKKGSSTLTAKKGNKSAKVKIQVVNKAADPNNNSDANITDMTLLTEVTFYKVTNVSGNNITVLSADNKEYTTTAKVDIPIMKDDEIITVSSIKAGDYFRCSPFTYNNVTTYAALVISEQDYQHIMKNRNEGKSEYTKSAATFYIVGISGGWLDISCSQNGEKYTTIILDEDTVVSVNGVKDKDSTHRLEVGQRVLIQYGWEYATGKDFVNLHSVVVY